MCVSLVHQCIPDAEFDCTGAGEHCIQMSLTCNRRDDCGNNADEDPHLCRHLHGISILHLAFVQLTLFQVEKLRS